MAKTNTKKKTSNYTHEGAPATAYIPPEQQLRRSVLSCLLWEREFYEDGASIADRIVELASKCPPTTVAALAVETRSKFNLRHVPLLLLVVLAKTASGTSILADTIPSVIQRADELAEFLAVYWRNGKQPLTAQMKKGLATAFQNFSAYQLAKYDRDAAIKLRDVMFLVHPKPKDAEQEAVWKKLVDGTLESPDTWEVSLSAGEDKKTAWERLLTEGNLGYMALLRNLRNMVQVDVDRTLIKDAILARKGAGRVLPFRFVAAARACPQMEKYLDKALVAAIDELPELPGKTVVLVDISASMNCRMSEKSDLRRMDAAAALASMINGDTQVFSFTARTVEVPPRRGMAGVDAIIGSQDHGWTDLGGAVAKVNRIKYDRLIVITDEQSHTSVPGPNGRGYMINVASYKNGVGYGAWVHIDGFSESVLQFIHEYEASV